MAALRRERVTIDLRGLAAALRGHAKANNTTLSALARRAVVEMLERSDVALTAACQQPTDRPDSEVVKVTIRMPRRVARQMAIRAHATGLSHCGYVRSLIEGAQAPSLVGHPRDAVQALAASTSDLAMLASDLHRLARLAPGGSPLWTDQHHAIVAALGEELRGHLGCASRLLAGLAPVAALRTGSKRTAGLMRS